MSPDQSTKSFLEVLRALGFNSNLDDVSDWGGDKHAMPLAWMCNENDPVSFVWANMTQWQCNRVGENH